MFKNRKLGFYLTFGAACLAVLAAAAYLIVYAGTADPVSGNWDRVFSWLTFGFLLGGAAVSLCGELFRIRIVPIAAAALYGVALANHLVETAYPLADVLTRVPFFGGNPTLAIAFAAVFLIVAIVHTVGAFMEHNN